MKSNHLPIACDREKTQNKKSDTFETQTSILSGLIHILLVEPTHSQDQPLSEWLALPL